MAGSPDSDVWHQLHGEPHAHRAARQQELFQGSSGIRVYANPDVFPRAWTVHQLLVAPNEWNGATMVRDGDFDLRQIAVMVKETSRSWTAATAPTHVTGI